MTLGLYGVFFLKLLILFAGVFVLTILTPKIAAFIDKYRKPGEEVPEAPRPERVEDDNFSENSGENADENNNKM